MSSRDQMLDQFQYLFQGYCASPCCDQRDPSAHERRALKIFSMRDIF
uniref:Uncharacterized protein n=1 Tax=Physcomitrium patens TaxID=3218 RepID=A0A2K1JUV4_PHYPA|nr:hypothetical protein PHYPA_015078 [Physcomitrium patens]